MNLLCKLPEDIEIYIYEFNPDHRILFKPCLEDIKKRINNSGALEYCNRETIREFVEELINDLLLRNTEDP
jgi:hypothetical protein